jgi:hypothetical protein
MSVLDFASQLHRYSIDEYDELVELGAFEGQRVELIDGLLLDRARSPIVTKPRSDGLSTIGWCNASTTATISSKSADRYALRHLSRSRTWP